MILVCHLAAFILKKSLKDTHFVLIDYLTALFQAYRKFGYEHGAAHIIIQMENTWLDSWLPMVIKLQVMRPIMYFID